MTDKTLDEHKAELAELMKNASEQTATPEGAQGAFGIPNLWGLVAARLFDAFEQIVQDAIQQHLNKGQEK